MARIPGVCVEPYINPQFYAQSRGKVQRALRYVKLKAEGLWPTCSVEGCDREAKNGAWEALRGPRRALGARART